ncbi:MAG: DUF2780 domain-containing protein [Schleiferiaceae bacterium]|nr:DUF2780 domain-containing protein [Schleiferiaceae bacterium]
MKFRILLAMLFSAALTTQAQTSDLIGMLTKEMGITSDQAEGGAGSIFGFAKENMSSTDFSSLAGVIPDMDGLLGAIPGGKKKSMLGQMADQLTGMPKVIDAFGKLGLKESHIKIMTPLLVDYVEKKGSKALSNTFLKAVTP